MKDEAPEQREGIMILLLSSRAESTVKKYLGAYGRWNRWTEENKVQRFPVLPLQFALYLEHLTRKTKSKSAVEEANHALSWVHEIAGLPGPGAHPAV